MWDMVPAMRGIGYGQMIANASVISSGLMKPRAAVALAQSAAHAALRSERPTLNFATSNQ